MYLQGRVNRLKAHLRTTVETLLDRGLSLRQVAKQAGVNRRTVGAIAAKRTGVATGPEHSFNQTAPPRPPGPGISTPGVNESACEPHRAFIEAQVELGRNATAIYQDLVDDHGFKAAYNSVKRFVGKLNLKDPERFDVLEFGPGEEAQVDYGQGAPTLQPNGKYKKPYLFVMTLPHSGKAFRKVVRKTNQEIWARLHEEAFRSFGGVPSYVVLDNLKEGVIKPDLYEPRLNPVYAAMLAHYGAVADPCRVRDPNRKGCVESGVKHTQSTALKGLRFESIEAQNQKLAHWEERWASPRIHGRKKRQVMEMFLEEKPHLRPLPAEPFRYFRQEVRTVDDGGFVQVDGSYYNALPARLYSEVTVRIYVEEIEVLDADGGILRRHGKSARKGSYSMEDGDRIMNPSRETEKLLRRARKIGPNTGTLAEKLFRDQGRPGKRALYGLTSLARTYNVEDIEAVTQGFVAADHVTFGAVRRALEQRAAQTPEPASALTQVADGIRDIDEYQSFFDTHSQETEPESET